MRRGLWLAVFAVAAHWQAAFAQIQVEPTYKLGTPIEAKYGAPGIPASTAKFTWSSPTVQFREIDGGRTAYCWAPLGKHTVTVDAAFTISVFTPDPEHPDDPTKAKRSTVELPPYQYSATFAVSGDG